MARTNHLRVSPVNSEYMVFLAVHIVYLDYMHNCRLGIAQKAACARSF